MGSCVSLHKDPESSLRLRLAFGSKNDKILIPSPIKEKPNTVNAGDRTVADVTTKTQWSHYGSKDEAFFDSQPWLDSDGEDDFLSVNGDFTPSRGSTPVHPSLTAGNTQVNKAPVVEGNLDSVPAPSPCPDKKKRLSELFKESLRVNQYMDEENEADDKNVVPVKATSSVLQSKSTDGTPYLSGANSWGTGGRTPSGLLGTEDKSMKSAQCCLPRLLSSRSFSERKKRTSPVLSVG